jgi:hypothetical protein
MVVVIEDRLPSDEGYVHRVDDVRDVGRGYVRVWFDVSLDGVERSRWDRLGDVAGRDVPMLEVA